MGLSRADVERVLQYLQAHAVEGACRLGDVRTLAAAMDMKPGRVKAVLYWLCGEGIILQQGDVVLLLRDMQEIDNV